MAKRVPLLSEMREPPQVGQFYLVPAIRYNYHGRVDVWPTIGPLHTDREHFNFPAPHYHVDPRFLTAKQATFLAGRAWGLHADRDLSTKLASITGSAPLAPRRNDPSPLPSGRPPLIRRKCRSTEMPNLYGSMDPVRALRRDFPSPTPPILRADGRKLCPHRKVDLSNLVPDEDGIVTCPLHGLRVDCRVPA